MIKGLNISLNRRFSGINNDDTKNSEYIVFGNFDTMDIKPVEKWYDFSPVVIHRNTIQTDNNFFDRYYVKLLFPPENEFVDYGFEYEFWKEINNDKKVSNHYYGLYLLSFAKDIVNRNNSVYELEKYLADILWNCYRKNNDVCTEDEIKNFFKHSYFSIYPMLGYFDLAVLFNTNNLSETLKLINSLNDESSIFNSSLILGQKSQKNENEVPLNEEDNKDVYLSVKLKTCPNFNREECARNLKKKFGNDVSINYVYGNSDLLLFHVPINNVTMEYLTDGYFNPESPLMRHNVKKIHSSVNLEARISQDVNQSVSGSIIKKLNSTNKIDSVTLSEINKFKQILKTYKDFQTEYHLSGRIVCGWNELINLYQESTMYPYTFDIKKVMGDSISTTLHCIEKSINYIYDLDNLNDVFYLMQTVNDFEYAASSLRNYFSEYLKSISFSDLHLMDGSHLPHTAGVFTTKFLFAYYQIVRQYTNFIINNDIETSENTHYSFLVISGNCDETVIIDHFNFLNAEFDPNEELLDEVKPFVIKISEKSLYSIQATMFHLFHECMHNCGNRIRKERAVFVTEFVCRLISDTIADFTFFSKNKILNITSAAQLTIANLDDFKKEIEELRSNYVKKIGNKILELLKPRIVDSFNGIDSKSYILDSISDKIFTEIMNVISLNQTDKNNFFCDVYNIVLNTEIEFFETIKKNFFSELYTNVDTIISTLRFYKSNTKDEYADKDLFQLLAGVINALVDNEIIFNSIDFNIDTSDEIKNILYKIRNENNVYVLVDLASTVFKECYADATAIQSLCVSFEEYIISFILDNENPYAVFHDDSLNSIRIGTILKNCFLIKSAFDLEQKKDSLSKFYSKYNDLFDENVFENAWEKLVLLCNSYFADDNFVSLDNYINLVKRTFEKYDYSEIESIRDFYSISCDESKTGEVIEFLYKFWSELSNE